MLQSYFTRYIHIYTHHTTTRNTHQFEVRSLWQAGSLLLGLLPANPAHRAPLAQLQLSTLGADAVLAYQTRLATEQRLAFVAYATDSPPDFSLSSGFGLGIGRVADAGAGGFRGGGRRDVWSLGLSLSWDLGFTQRRGRWNRTGGLGRGLVAKLYIYLVRSEDIASKVRVRIWRMLLHG